MPRVFLGGTCEGFDWRNESIIPHLKIDHFNPVVDDWNEQAMKNELYERENCDYVLYMITPGIKGVYSIAEVIDDSNKRPGKTVFCFVNTKEKPEIGSTYTVSITDDYGKLIEKHWFDSKMEKSLNAVGAMVERNGGTWCKDVNEVIEYLNSK